MKTLPKIGIVSGVGPLAGADVFTKLLTYAAHTYGAVEDSEYPDIVLVSQGIAGVDNTGAMNDEFQAGIVAMVKQLEKNKANIIGIACNTAHLYLDKIHVNKGTVVVNLIDEVAKQAATTDRKYLLLTSATSKQQMLYQGYLQNHGVSFGVTTKAQQKLLDDAIGLVMACKLSEAGALMQQVLHIAKKDGYTVVIAGCTELPIAIDNAKGNYGLDILSSNKVLAQVLADTYYAKYKISDH